MQFMESYNISRSTVRQAILELVNEVLSKTKDSEVIRATRAIEATVASKAEAHDLGTSGNKATLYTTSGKLVKSIVSSYDTH